MVTFPDQITAGETLKASVCVSDAASVVGYVVGAAKHTLTFEQSGNTWTSDTDTSGWLAGRYRYEIWVTRDDGTRQILERASLTVLPSLEDAEGGEDFDTTTRAQRMVEKIEAMLEGNASAGVRRYRINNRELERYTLAELMELLAYWKRQLAMENRKAKGQSVLGPRISFRI